MTSRPSPPRYQGSISAGTAPYGFSSICAARVRSSGSQSRLKKSMLSSCPCHHGFASCSLTSSSRSAPVLELRSSRRSPQGHSSLHVGHLARLLRCGCGSTRTLPTPVNGLSAATRSRIRRTTFPALRSDHQRPPVKEFSSGPVVRRMAQAVRQCGSSNTKRSQRPASRSKSLR